MNRFNLSVALLAVLVFMGCSGASTGMGGSLYNRESITNPTDALALLKAGEVRFFNNKNLRQDLSVAKRTLLAGGQSPFVSIVSCSDSRVVSPYIFDQGLGDVFEIKLAGNIVDADALGSIEYGVTKLNTPLVVVLAHEACGAVHATVDINEGKMQLPRESSINSIVQKITPSYNAVKAGFDGTDLELKELISVENANNMKNEILKNSGIKAKVDSGDVQVVVAKYMLDGSVVWQ
ncbi:MAG: carbonic anhydrase [Spirochaetia bacterium]